MEDNANKNKLLGESLRYIVAGVLTTFVSLGVKWLLLFTVLDPSDPFQLQVAVVVSWIAAVSFAYVINRSYVFRSNDTRIIREVVSFFSSRVSTLLVEVAIMWFIVTFLGLNSDQWVFAATLIVQVVVMVLNYVFSKLFVFRNPA